MNDRKVDPKGRESGHPNLSEAKAQSSACSISEEQRRRPRRAARLMLMLMLTTTVLMLALARNAKDPTRNLTMPWLELAGPTSTKRKLNSQRLITRTAYQSRHTAVRWQGRGPRHTGRRGGVTALGAPGQRPQLLRLLGNQHREGQGRRVTREVKESANLSYRQQQERIRMQSTWALLPRNQGAVSQRPAPAAA